MSRRSASGRNPNKHCKTAGLQSVEFNARVAERLFDPQPRQLSRPGRAVLTPAAQPHLSPGWPSHQHRSCWDLSAAHWRREQTHAMLHKPCRVKCGIWRVDTMGHFGVAMANGTGHPTSTAGGAGRGDDALQRAVYALNNQNPSEAQRIAGDILKAEPRHAQALYVLGGALLMQGRAEEAITSLETAARGRHDPAMDTQLAIALRQAGRPDDALARLKRTTKRHPAFAPALHELGRLLVAMERYDEAIEVLSRGVEIAPMMPQLSIQLGYALLSRRMCVEAKVAFARALDVSPGSADALFGIAKAHRKLGENEAAAEYFQRSLMSKSDDQAAWLSLGHCLLELGRSEAGIECFRAAARGDPRHYGNALSSLVASARGRFWLKPSAANQFLASKHS
jgi:tetratricopeptide (TPR) repeat protein